MVSFFIRCVDKSGWLSKWNILNSSFNIVRCLFLREINNDSKIITENVKKESTRTRLKPFRKLTRISKVMIVQNYINLSPIKLVRMTWTWLYRINIILSPIKLAIQMTCTWLRTDFLACVIHFLPLPKVETTPQIWWPHFICIRKWGLV
jgi:hypothetical protein